MAKAFSNIKQGLGLLDIFTFGKYNQCRVDSIIDQDSDYVEYLRFKKICIFDKSVLNKLDTLYTTEVEIQEPKYEYRNKFLDLDDWDDDIPF